MPTCFCTRKVGRSSDSLECGLCKPESLRHTLPYQECHEALKRWNLLFVSASNFEIQRRSSHSPFTFPSNPLHPNLCTPSFQQGAGFDDDWYNSRPDWYKSWPVDRKKLALRQVDDMCTNDGWSDAAQVEELAKVTTLPLNNFRG
jgi:hypothetical protein